MFCTVLNQPANLRSCASCFFLFVVKLLLQLFVLSCHLVINHSSLICIMLREVGGGGVFYFWGGASPNTRPTSS